MFRGLFVTTLIRCKTVGGGVALPLKYLATNKYFLRSYTCTLTF